jgi:hypothetical protein
MVIRLVTLVVSQGGYTMKFIREISYANITGEQMVDLEAMGFVLKMKTHTVEIWAEVVDFVLPKVA